MALRDELLVPIPGANPAGAELRYDPVYDKIKEARREDDDAPQGDWQTERKVADWPLVIKLTKDALSKRSKDLQLAVWLTEAMLKREGLGGLRAGLDLLDVAPPPEPNFAPIAATAPSAALSTTPAPGARPLAAEAASREDAAARI